MPAAEDRSGETLANVVAWATVVAAIALIVAMVVTSDGERSDAASAASTPAPTATSERHQLPVQPGPEPGGAPRVLATADEILDAYNQRDSAPLRAWACQRTTVSDDLFAGFSETVTFVRDGDPHVVGFTAEVPFVVSDEGRQRAGSMRLRWDGNRWCFVTAVTEPD